MSFHIDDRAVDVDDYAFQPAFIQQLFEQFEIYVSDHLCGPETKLPKKPWNRFRLFDLYAEFLDKRVALQQFYPLQLVYAEEIAAKKRFDMVHFDFLNAVIGKSNFAFQQLEQAFAFGMAKQQQQSGIGCEVLCFEVNFVNHAKLAPYQRFLATILPFPWSSMG